MSFPSKLVVSGIVLVLFSFGFGEYQAHYPWPSPLAMYPCLLVVGLLGFFHYGMPSKGH